MLGNLSVSAMQQIDACLKVALGIPLEPWYNQTLCRVNDCVFRQAAERTAIALQARCWDEALGIYVDLAGIEERPLRVKTPASFVPLFAGVPTAVQASWQVERLTSPTEFWPAYPVPCVSLDEPTCSTDRYWRGPTWVHLNLMIALGLHRYGYDAIADELTQQTATLIDQHGF